MIRLLPAILRMTPWLVAIKVVQFRLGHMGSHVSHTTVPTWLTIAVNARVADGLTWGDIIAIVGLIIVAAVLALASFAWLHMGEAIYDLWLMHDIRYLCEHRPWKKTKIDEEPAEKPKASKKERKAVKKTKKNKRKR